MLDTGKAFDPRLRGYAIFYRPGGNNVCPGCGRGHWYVGRISAECAFCAVALPIADSRPMEFPGLDGAVFA